MSVYKIECDFPHIQEWDFDGILCRVEDRDMDDADRRVVRRAMKWIVYNQEYAERILEELRIWDEEGDDE